MNALNVLVVLVVILKGIGSRSIEQLCYQSQPTCLAVLSTQPHTSLTGTSSHHSRIAPELQTPQHLSTFDSIRPVVSVFHQNQNQYLKVKKKLIKKLCMQTYVKMLWLVFFTTSVQLIILSFIFTCKCFYISRKIGQKIFFDSSSLCLLSNTVKVK